MTDPTDVLLVDVRDHVATVTLNRPDARNALSTELLRRLPATFAELDADDAVHVVILTGTDPAFCAGLDLRELGSTGDNLRAGEADGAGPAGPFGRRGPIPAMSKPVIGAINGAAITGGFELALACDFLVASEHARFADTHARVGVQPGWGLTVLLPEAVGVRRAREMSVSGNFLTAMGALTWGLVNHVVPHDQLLDFCRDLAHDIVSNDRDGVRHILGTYAEGTAGTTADAWEVEARRSREWSGGRIDPAAVEARRQAIIERGRAQL